MKNVKLGEISIITKLAGFEHTEYIQKNSSKSQNDNFSIPLFIGRTIRDGQISESDYEWFIPKHISDLLPRSQLKEKCLVMPYVGTVGDIAIFDKPYRCHLGSNVAKITLCDNSIFSEEYIYYYLKSTNGQAQIKKHIQGAIQKNITMEKLRDIEIELISVERQEKIVKILSAIDSQIQRNNDMVHKLQVLGSTIYSKKLQSIKSFKNIDLSEIKTGKEDANFATANGKYKFFTCSEDTFLCDTFAFEGKSILVAGNGNFNVKFSDGRFNAYQRVYVISNNEEYGNLYYTYLYNVQALSQKANGSIIKFLTLDMLKNIHVPIFSVETNKLLNDVVFKIYHIDEQNKKLHKLKFDLLPLLINGQLFI